VQQCAHARSSCLWAGRKTEASLKSRPRHSRGCAVVPWTCIGQTSFWGRLQCVYAAVAACPWLAGPFAAVCLRRNPALDRRERATRAHSPLVQPCLVLQRQNRRYPAPSAAAARFCVECALVRPVKVGAKPPARLSDCATSHAPYRPSNSRHAGCLSTLQLFSTLRLRLDRMLQRWLSAWTCCTHNRLRCDSD
jgi:hypothetical protein